MCMDLHHARCMASTSAVEWPFAAKNGRHGFLDNGEERKNVTQRNVRSRVD